jgi:hypothetical protein
LFWLLAAVVGCSSAEGGSEPQGATGGAASVAGHAGSSGTGAIVGCPGPAPATLPATGRVDLAVRLAVGGAAAAIGQVGTGSSGRQFKLSLFKFFLAEPVLIASDGHESKAQLLSPAGAPEPYGLHLVDADDAATQQLRLAAPPGQYSALRFGVGVPQPCNQMGTTTQVFPLNPDSEMFWDWASKFMFLRVEGEWRRGESESFQGFVYHVGYDQAYGTVNVSGALAVSSGGLGPTLSLDVDRMLANDAASLPPARHTVPEGWVVDNLEQNQAFKLQ